MVAALAARFDQLESQVAQPSCLVGRSRYDELKVAESPLELDGFGVQRITPDGDAVVVGPSDVVGIGARDRRAPAFMIALIEDLEQVGVHQFSDGVDDDVPPDESVGYRHNNPCE